MESLPPEAPMAMRSPAWKSWLVNIVLWISVSKILVKQVLQSFWWFLGRIIRAREVLQRAQGEVGIVV